jgi:predicted nucleotidyltransferase component of viral defense system
MASQKEYYLDKLYPLQDRVLAAIAQCETSFYLTGGTALGRGYLHHRYSDDLDFFVNDAADFSVQVDNSLRALRDRDMTFTIEKRSDDFSRILCSSESVDLKVDFVNDIPFHSNGIETLALFPRVDSWWNILSNKICALERGEPKDVADILFLCRRYTFMWEDVFREAGEKTTYIDPLIISTLLAGFPMEYFSRVRWMAEFPDREGGDDLQRIARDILEKRENSLPQM